MPLYEYECKKCHHRFEKIQSFSAPHTKKCPDCGGAVEQVISAPAVQFKGSGWYVTDYAKKASMPPAGSGDAGSKGDSGGKSESASKSDSDSKSDSSSKSDSNSKSESSSKKEEKSRSDSSRKKSEKK